MAYAPARHDLRRADRNVVKASSGRRPQQYNPTVLIRASCHCGNISFALDWTPDPAEIPARACTCTFCVKHGAVWTSCPSGSLRIRIANPALASCYAFGTATAEFHVCSRCGVVPVATSRIADRLFAVVNVNTFDDLDASLLRRSSSTLDGESGDVRLARRARNWIGDVALVYGDAVARN